MKTAAQLLPKELRLTPAQHRALAVFERAGVGKDLATWQVGNALGYEQRYVRGYLFHRLRSLERRGFLVCKMTDGGRKAWWRQGPLCDLLREHGLMR